MVFITAQQRTHGHNVQMTTHTEVVVAPGQLVSVKVSNDLVCPFGHFQQLIFGGHYITVSTDIARVRYFNEPMSDDHSS